jgi:hypothetical protein
VCVAHVYVALASAEHIKQSFPINSTRNTETARKYDTNTSREEKSELLLQIYLPNNLNIIVFWDVVPCSLVAFTNSSGAKFYLHLQGQLTAKESY